MAWAMTRTYFWSSPNADSRRAVGHLPAILKTGRTHVGRISVGDLQFVAAIQRGARAEHRVRAQPEQSEIAPQSFDFLMMARSTAISRLTVRPAAPAPFLFP